ncbi:SNF2 family domain-containing protein [Plectosphaerella plurivora]|uniref:SNF2 family domain-containing protein n=1 Tax=Plectosphaerella plurivora TaxID=936078 RepID=A0A9P9A7U3_9PEZI|nr:SNF2 family domain-containing protein [Plectosphaerella plurivora]
MDNSSTSEGESIMSKKEPDFTPASSPPPIDMDSTTKDLLEEEVQARLANEKAQERRRKMIETRKKNKKPETKLEREKKAKELDDLLKKSAAFSDMLTKKTSVLGRVGTSLDGKSLGEHQLVMAKQPKCLVGGTMRDYQLEGLTWMYEICQQGMSGILADEMGLGKTIQVISLIALLREEDYLGPHLVVAPLSTLSNWVNEFKKWCPSIPVCLFHGTKDERKVLLKDMRKHVDKSGRPTDKFPIICTSYEMVLREATDLRKFNWGFVIIDEGHRMKNVENSLFRELCAFKSATRMLITGTPLQNDLRELWSLLHFLLPAIFTDWNAFESWFDFSDLQHQEGAEEFIGDKSNHELIKKLHLILQPLLLRRVKADVASYLPKKREYVLYAPMTREQTDLYNAISDKKTDTRSFLENKVAEKLSTPRDTPRTSRSSSVAKVKSEKASPALSLPLRQSPRKSREDMKSPTPVKKNAFAIMMEKKAAVAPRETRGRAAKSSAANSSAHTSAASSPAPKRKTPPTTETPPPTKSAKSSRHSTPAPSTRGSRKASARRKAYTDAGSDEDDLSDDEFEAKLAREAAKKSIWPDDPFVTEEDQKRAQTLEQAKAELAGKKLGNDLMQLRLVSNSPHNFYNPWGYDNGVDVDETVVTSSGKMLLLDRLLGALFERGHKVLIFSQFRTQIDILHDYCLLRKYKLCRIDGSVIHTSRQEQIDSFNNDPDTKIFLLSTRAGGQGINLTAADTVILFDSDWNPQQDLQAQDRCHRIGQTRPVIIYRLATKGTVEEQLLMSADAKRRLEKLVIKKGGFKTLGQKMDNEEGLDEETLKSLLLADGEVYKHSGGDQILSDQDLEVICDRSDEAYARAAKGQGDAEAFKIVETAANGILSTASKK